MRWFVGIPAQCQRLGEYTYRHRGQVTFQLYRNGVMWGCQGFKPPLTLQDRAMNRAWNRPANEPGMISVMHEAGWLHFRKKATIRAVCRAIDSELRRAMLEDAAHLEAKGLRIRP